MVRARQYRLARIREQILAFDCTSILLYDPVNIYYGLDSFPFEDVRRAGF